MMKKLPLFLLLSIQPSLASFNSNIIENDSLSKSYMDTYPKKEIDNLEVKQSYITVVDGYIRSEQKQLDNTVPTLVNQIVLLYYFNFFDNIQEIGNNDKIHSKKVTLCFYSEMNVFFSASSVINVWIWKPQKRTYESHTTLRKRTIYDLSNSYQDNLIRSLCYSHEKKRLFSGHSTGVIKIWDISNLKKLRLLNLIKAHSFAVTSLHYDSQENILFSGGSDKTIRKWNLNKSKESDATSELRERKPMDLAYDPRRKLLFFGELLGEIICIYNTNTENNNECNKLITRINIKSEKEKLQLMKLCYNPRTQRLFCGCTRGILQIFDVSNLEKCSLMQLIKWKESATLSTLYCSPQSYFLFCANTSGDIKIYNVFDPRRCYLIKHFKSDTPRPSSLAYNPTQNFLLCGYYNGLLNAWGVK